MKHMQSCVLNDDLMYVQRALAPPSNLYALQRASFVWRERLEFRARVRTMRNQSNDSDMCKSLYALSLSLLRSLEQSACSSTH